MTSRFSHGGQPQTDQKPGKRPRQREEQIPGIPGLFLATYPSGRRTYIFRFRDSATGRKTSMTLGEAE